ncbi:conserved hypothetical protein [Paraburkholderia sabiae]|jgi:uncharacterized membrane protein YbhN (UPF0104 family)|uniref:hypothetical protein n=1 Tax=Paraburkholderia sabiae TaxID=273251 RepID=UPI001CB580FE|nr:hypothetical protein [Paraburkholderia sabiae]CAG9192553.1 conserved hypothetical protein [Paraburkholderia sabiae]
MPIVVALLVLIGLIYGCVQAFHALSAHFGLGVAVGVAILFAALVLAALAWWWRRRKEVAANIRDGDWTHELKGEWGDVRLAAGKRLCDVRVAGARGSYIFADLRGAQPVRDGERWQVALQVKDAAHPEWRVPVKSEREARQWARIFVLAMGQKL